MARMPISASSSPAAASEYSTTKSVTEPSVKVYEQALTLAAMGFFEEALTALRDVAVRAPAHAPVWRKLAELLRLAGQDKEADAAEACADGKRAEWSPAVEPRALREIEDAETSLRELMGKIAVPLEQATTLRGHLRHHETDVTAMRLLARLEWSCDDLATARALFERALGLAPDYDGARADYAQLLRALGDHAQAVVETDRLVAREPANAAYRTLHADALYAMGDLESAIPALEQLIREQPPHVRFRAVYAQALHFVGRRRDSAREFRECLDLQPGFGKAYWGLAELRGNFLTPKDIADMRKLLSNADGDKPRDMLIQYSLGHALEQAGEFPESFAAYQAGAATAREIAAGRGRPSNSIENANRAQRYLAAYSGSVLTKQATPQNSMSDATPIFIVGMPRAGSTLVEQILASHSLVEGTMELPLIASITQDLTLSRRIVTPNAYPECVHDLPRSQLSKLGERYLEEARPYRKTDRPYFVDKRPWNWLEVGLIHMILPQAKIIDVRREPMAACFAMFKQMLTNDAEFSNDFDHLAQYYTQYEGVMEHWKSVLPGRVHFLQYERLVEDTEAEIRRQLDYCGLPFEESCLHFWETDRTVSTPSAEQVRRPIFRDALQQWHKFEPWLGPLKDALEEARAYAAATPHPEAYERALSFVAMGLYPPAIEELRNFVAHQKKHSGAWKTLAQLLRWQGDDKAAADAEAAAARCASEASKWRPNRDPRTYAQLEAAERKLLTEVADLDSTAQMEMLREHLDHNPTDAAATYVLSRLEAEDGDTTTSVALLRRTVEISPLYSDARSDLAILLLRGSKFAAALEQTSILVKQAPRDPEFRAIHSGALRCVGNFPAALAITEDLVREQSQDPRVWFGYGQLLHSVGRRDESAKAFRGCLERAPLFGEAYWGLADLKSGFLNETDIAAMRAKLTNPALDPTSRMNLYYALGRALEEKKDYAASFAAYHNGARLFRGFFLARGQAYTEDAFIEKVQCLKRTCSRSLLAKHMAHTGASTDATPIFIVGMPRAGSTLVEQILASHSLVEGTMELPLIGGITEYLEQSRRIETPNAYPECMHDLTRSQLSELGSRYLEEAKAYRKTNRPYFTDKRPWNWLEVGLIHLILPHAKIIDIRREPMAACFAMFKQVMTDAADVSYDLRALGRYYREYVGVMEHWNSVLPGRIHFLQYEQLVEDTEGEIRRLLEYCGLPFEEGCLRFWETTRAVSTPSAEQVRRPIFRDAVQHWRNFEPWLGPLKAGLEQPSPG